MPANRLAELLRALASAGVDFVVVGGLAAVLDGAPVVTFDVAVVHSRDNANVARLFAALRSLEAVFRIQPERRTEPAEAHLAGPGHLNLITRFGPLDVLGTIGSGLGYADLLPHTARFDVGEGVQVDVLSLEMLIALKEELDTEKDRAVLPVLRRTLAEKRAGRY